MGRSSPFDSAQGGRNDNWVVGLQARKRRQGVALQTGSERVVKGHASVFVAL